MADSDKRMKGPRFAEAPGFLLAGIRRHHKFSDAPVTVPKQWEEFRMFPLRDSRAPRAYGVICASLSDSFEYMTALEVDDFDNLPATLGRMRVPPQLYAVFTHQDHVSKVGSTWDAIVQEWLPRSNYVDAETPAFELYDHRFSPETGEGGFEVWFPVARRTSATADDKGLVNPSDSA